MKPSNVVMAWMFGKKMTHSSIRIVIEHFSNFRDEAVEFVAWAIIDTARMISKISISRSTK